MAERDFLGSQLQAASEQNAHLTAAVELQRAQLLQVCALHTATAAGCMSSMSAPRCKPACLHGN